MVVQEALKCSLKLDKNPGWIPENPVDDHSRAASLLIHDIFGGEILKTPKKKGWHFYNRINGERIDFMKTDMGKSSEENLFQDLPSTPDETQNYFEQEEYANFFMRFIWAFEEAVGLDKYQPAHKAGRLLIQ
jgi:hypothetical protein